jgi:hypothetical protein
MGIFEEYAAETAFPLDNPCSNGNTEDELHWGANLPEIRGSEFVCRAASCFLQMRVHQTQNGLDLHMRLLHWTKHVQQNPRVEFIHSLEIEDRMKLYVSQA